VVQALARLRLANLPHLHRYKMPLETGIVSDTREETWVIKHFSVIREQLQQREGWDRCLKSPTMFTVNGIDFNVRLLPDGKTDEQKGKVWMYFWAGSSINKNQVVSVRSTLSVMHDILPRRILEHLKHDLKPDSGFGANLRWEEVKSYLQHDTLTVHVKAEFFGGIQHSGIVASRGEVKSSLAADYRSLMETGMGSDVILKFLGGERRAHKIILQCRSPVFRCMFGHAMQEMETGTVEITDAEAESLDSFLLYLYTDECPKAEIAGETLKLAKKYEVAALVEFCSQQIVSGLTVNNAVETLLLADKYDLTTVKEATINFISRDRITIQAIQDTEAFSELSKELVMELFAALAGTKRKRTASLEFPDGSDWSNLSVIQLRRACVERSLPKVGAKASLVERLTE